MGVFAAPRAKIHLTGIRMNSFTHILSAVRGNARVIVITEGISNIFFQWYSIYLPLYLLALGLSELSIGWLTSVFLLTQFIGTLAGGHFADRFGRKRVLVVGDILLWGVPLLLFAVAQNPWYILAGRLINGLLYIVIPSFDCLFVEDTPEADRPAVFGLLQFLMAAGSLLAPISGLLVARLGMVTAGRIIMLATMAAAVGIAILRQFTLVETSTGRERMAAVREAGAAASPASSRAAQDTRTFNGRSASWASTRRLLGEYRGALRAITAGPQVRAFLLVKILTALSAVVWTTYAAIYLTAPNGPGIPGAPISAAWVGALPFVSAAVTLAALLLSASRLTAGHLFANLALGQGLWLAGALAFLFVPGRGLPAAVLWTLVHALSAVFYQPASLAYWANLVDDRQRALIFSTASALIALCVLPAAPLAGMLYGISPRLPFVATLLMQAAALALILQAGARDRRGGAAVPVSGSAAE